MGDSSCSRHVDCVLKLIKLTPGRSRSRLPRHQQPHPRQSQDRHQPAAETEGEHTTTRESPAQVL